MDTVAEQLPQTDAAVIMGMDVELLHGLPECGSCGAGCAYSSV